MSQSWLLPLGFLLGLRHACDPDHVVAVTSILGRTHRLQDGLRIGLFWGLGHSATVFSVGFAIVVLGVRVPARFDTAMELVVAAMLVVVGALAMRRLDPSTAPNARSPSLRPAAVGVVHGLAGSATVALLAMTELPSRGLALLYLFLFGAGTLAGMGLVTVVLALPFVGSRRGLLPLQAAIVRLAGASSVVLGGVMAVRRLFELE